MSEMSMSDVIALQGRNDGMGMGGSSWLWWVLLIFLLGGNGWGGYGGNAQQGITNDFLFSNLNSGIQSNATRINQVGDGLSSSTYALNNTLGQMKYENAMGQNNIQNAINTMGMNFQSCCCETRNAMNTGFAGIQNTMQMNTMQLMQNECNNTQKIIDLINQTNTQALRDKLNEYQVSASNAAQSAYLISQLKTS